MLKLTFHVFKQMPGPIKPRLKASEKFSELEKKIATLTNALVARSQEDVLQQHTPPGSKSSGVSPQDLMQQHPSPPAALQNLSLRNSVAVSDPPWRTSVNGRGRTLVDVIDQGFIDLPTAEVLFNHWNMTMVSVGSLLPADHFALTLQRAFTHTIRLLTKAFSY